MRARLLLLLLAGTPLCAQDKYQSKDFPVRNAYHGTLAQVRMNTKTAKRFRTVIREQAKEGVNFAGHYRIVGWGCGLGCTTHAIVDIRTGQVYDVPYASVQAIPDFRIPDPLRESAEIIKQYRRFEFSIDSELLVIGGVFNDDAFGVRYYRWHDNHLNLLLELHPGVPPN